MLTYQTPVYWAKSILHWHFDLIKPVGEVKDYSDLIKTNVRYVRSSGHWAVTCLDSASLDTGTSLNEHDSESTLTTR